MVVHQVRLFLQERVEEVGAQVVQVMSEVEELQVEEEEVVLQVELYLLPLVSLQMLEQ